jgi:uncharacterized membrane protein (DUF4010 family)
MRVVSEIHRADTLADSSDEEEMQKIFSLKPALKFALILILVRAITKSALILFGESGFLLTSVFASLTGIDAVVINLAELAKSTITPQAALLTFVAVNATNLISKSVYSFTAAKKEFSLKFLASIVFIILTSFVGYYFLA